MYYIYVGQYEKEGTPATWTITGKVPKSGLKKHIKELVPNLKMGMELYIITPENEVKAYFRDELEKYFIDK